MNPRYDGLYFNPEYNLRYGSALRFFPNGWVLMDNYLLERPFESFVMRLGNAALGRYHIEGSRIWITCHLLDHQGLRPGRLVYQGQFEGEMLRTHMQSSMMQQHAIPLKYDETFTFQPRDLPDEPDLEEMMMRWLGPQVPWRVHEPDGAELVRVANRFWIYRLPVRVRQYHRVIAQHGRGLPDAPSGGWLSDMPAVKITWQEAADYASWVGARLPTAEEWGLAWGDWIPRSAYIAGKGVRPVWLDPGDVSPPGVMDLAGNISEWSEKPGVVLGGSYRSKSLDDCRKTTKTKAASAPWIGFRCVVD